MSLEPGTILGPYRILALLGAGGMGEVYRALDPKLGREVAIKVLPERFAEDPERLRRFEREARVLAALAHPNILDIHDFGASEGRPYLVMELLKGQTLRALMAEGPMAPERAAELAEQVAAGLAAAHERGIVHRDLKPENLFVTADRVVKILDFGLARPTGPTEASQGALTESGFAVGTPAYMSPEQLSGKVVDFRSDQFSLGVILLEMLTGSHPYQGETAMGDPRRHFPDHLARVPMAGILRRCLARDPCGRFDSTRELARELIQARSGRAGWRRRGGWLRPATWRVAVVLAGLLVPVIAAWAWHQLGFRKGDFDPRCVAILPFQNRTGDGSLDGLGRQVADLVRQDLQAVENLKVASDRPAAPGAEDAVLRLAQATRARFVATGDYYLRGREVELQARVVDPWEGRLIYTLGPWRGDREALEPALAELRQWLGGALATAYSKLIEFEPGTVRATRLDAYLAMRKAWLKRVTDYEGFMAGAKAALRLDPSYFTPLFCMVDVLFDQGRYAEADGIIRRMEGDYERCTPVERCIVRWLRADIEGHYAEVLKAFDDLRSLGQKNPRLSFIRAQYELALNRPRRAIAELRSVGRDESRPLELADWWPANYLGWAYHQAGDYEHQLQAAREGLAASPDVLVFRNNEVAALAALGQVAEVHRILDLVPGLRFRAGAGAPWSVRQVAMRELREHGWREESRRVARGILADLEDPSFEPKAMLPALKVEALATLDRFEEALVLAQAQVRLHPEDPRWQGWQGSLLACLGRDQEARRVDRDLAGRSGPFLHGAVQFQRARIAAQLGEDARAVELLRRAFGEGLRYGASLRWSAEFDRLQNNPAFEDLMRPKD